MSAAASSRRDALRAGALTAGALALGGLVRPLSAAAQASPETEDLRDFLAEAIAREQISALAYAEAGQGGGLDAKSERTLTQFREQAQAHVNALESAIESIGYDGPDAPSDPEDDGVFDGVDGIDSETATELSDLLATLAQPASSEEHVALLTDLERGLINFYATSAPGLDSEDLRTTCAELAANAAQHLVVLRLASGTSLANTLTVRTDAGDETEE